MAAAVTRGQPQTSKCINTQSWQLKCCKFPRTQSASGQMSSLVSRLYVCTVHVLRVVCGSCNHACPVLCFVSTPWLVLQVCALKGAILSHSIDMSSMRDACDVCVMCNVPGYVCKTHTFHIFRNRLNTECCAF